MNVPRVQWWCEFFDAIHDRHRQRILELLKQRRQLNATQIIKLLKLSQPTVSHHLKILQRAKLLHALKQGKMVVYSINDKAILDCCGSFMKRYSRPPSA